MKPNFDRRSTVKQDIVANCRLVYLSASTRSLWCASYGYLADIFTVNVLQKRYVEIQPTVNTTSA